MKSLKLDVFKVIFNLDIFIIDFNSRILKKNIEVLKNVLILDVFIKSPKTSGFSKIL